MKATRVEMKAEAIKRMKMLNLLPETISHFAQGDIVSYSENVALFPVLYWIENNGTEWEDAYKKWVAENPDKLVYHVIHNLFEFGEVVSILYVSEYKEDWEYEDEDIKCGYVFCHSMNLTDEWCSDYGSIAVKPMYGGLKRIS